MNIETTLAENEDVTESILRQAQAQEGTHYALKETALDLFEFGANMALRHESVAEQQAYGIVLHYNEQERLLIQFLKQDHKQVKRWTLAVESVGIAPAINRVLPLAPAFNPTERHSLRIMQQHESIVIFVDGSELLTVSEAFRPVQPGLFTHNVSVAFTAVS